MSYGDIKSVPLVQRKENLRFAGLENEVQNVKYYESVSNPRLYKEIANKVVAATLSVTVALGGFGIAKYISDVKQEANSEIVYVADVPDEIDGNLDIKVFVQANGEAYLEDANGNKSSKLDDISAERIAELTGYQGELADSKSVHK